MTEEGKATGLIEGVKRQLFTYPLENNHPHTIEKAKQEMAQCASEMGFIQNEGFVVQKFNCRDTGTMKYRLEANFNTW